MSTPSHSHSHSPDPARVLAAHGVDPTFESSHDNPHAHHGHFIIAPSTLLFVFGALLAFTFLTVGAAKAEEMIAHGFGIIIPQWINVAVALSIAVVKTSLVIGFFMQLRYDNPLNTMVFAFTIVCVLCFFGFTMTDLANRQTIDRFKGEYIINGGTGLPTTAEVEYKKEHPEAQLSAEKRPITASAHEIAVMERSPLLEEEPGGGHGHAPAGLAHSSSNLSRPVRGVTLPGLAAPAESHGGH